MVRADRIFLIPILVDAQALESRGSNYFDRVSPTLHKIGLSYYEKLRNKIVSIYKLSEEAKLKYLRETLIQDLVGDIYLILFENFWFPDPSINYLFATKDWYIGVLLVFIREDLNDPTKISIHDILNNIVQPQYIIDSFIVRMLSDLLGTLYRPDNNMLLEKLIAGITRICLVRSGDYDSLILDLLVMYSLSVRETVFIISKLINDPTRLKHILGRLIVRDKLADLDARFIPMGVCISGGDESIDTYFWEILDIMIFITIVHFIISVIDEELIGKEVEISDPKRLSVEDYEQISRLRKEMISLYKYIYEADAFNSALVHSMFLIVFKNMGFNRYLADIRERISRVDDIIRSVVSLRAENIQIDLLEEMQRMNIQDKMIAVNLRTLNYLIASSFTFKLVGVFLAIDLIALFLSTFNLIIRSAILIVLYLFSWILVFYLLRTYAKIRIEKVRFGRIIKFFPREFKSEMPHLLDALFNPAPCISNYFDELKIINYIESQELITLTLRYSTRIDGKKHRINISLKYSLASNNIYAIMMETMSLDRNSLYEEYRNFARKLNEYYDCWCKQTGVL